MAKKEMTDQQKESAAKKLVELIMNVEKNFVKSNEKRFDGEAVNKISKMLEEVYKDYETEETND